MQCFATQLNNTQQTTHSLRHLRHRTLKKRSRGRSPDASSPSEPAAASSARACAPHAAPDTAQWRVAGLRPEDDGSVPPSPFPHAPLPRAEGSYGAKSIQHDMAQPPTRLYALHPVTTSNPATPQSDAASLKKTHLNVLSAVMHRCLLDGDYQRAGRAWGMLLRTHVAGGHAVDPRNHARWGVGAEILLRKHDIFSEQGFDLARDYYQRLIVQFPHRNITPHAIDARSFLPAMFSLWILATCEQSKQARQHIRPTAQTSRSPSMSDSNMDHAAFQSDDSPAQADAVQVEELARATEIAERLDQLIASPPFDKQASLLHLRGHVSLWLSALLLGHDTNNEDGSLPTNSEPKEDDPLPVSVQLSKSMNCQSELHRAQQFLHRAEANGASPQSATLTSVEIKLKELARHMASLRAEI
ncbi:hypothetical protein ACEQ8H_002950 [Pleosporales sp. CAS-2024a]